MILLKRTDSLVNLNRKDVVHVKLASTNFLLIVFALFAPIPAQAALIAGININLGLGPLFNPLPSGTLTPPAILSYTESPTMATMSIVGGDFDSDSIISFGIKGDYWTSTFSISQDSGFVNDVLSVSGTFQHTVSPPGHNDNPFGSLFNWNFVLDADDAIGALVSDSKHEEKPHGPLGHKDIFDATLTASVTSTINFDDISGWTFTLEAKHLPAAIPLPSSLWLFGSGLIAFFRVRAVNYNSRLTRL